MEGWEEWKRKNDRRGKENWIGNKVERAKNKSNKKIERAKNIGRIKKTKPM